MLRKGRFLLSGDILHAIMMASVFEMILWHFGWSIWKTGNAKSSREAAKLYWSVLTQIRLVPICVTDKQTGIWKMGAGRRNNRSSRTGSQTGAPQGSLSCPEGNLPPGDPLVLRSTFDDWYVRFPGSIIVRRAFLLKIVLVFPKCWGIATPVWALARNDHSYLLRISNPNYAADLGRAESRHQKAGKQQGLQQKEVAELEAGVTANRSATFFCYMPPSLKISIFCKNKVHYLTKAFASIFCPRYNRYK